jgi:hypothetical protein
VLELGSVDTKAEDATTTEFVLPAGVAAFTLVLEDFEDVVPSVTRLVAPDGTVLIGNDASDGGFDLARCSSTRGVATVLVPGSDRPHAAPIAGRYLLEVSTYSPENFPVKRDRIAGRIERLALVQKVPEAGGQVDLTFHLAPELGLDAADAGNNPLITGMIFRAELLLRSKLGLTLGTPRFVDLPPDAGANLSTIVQNQRLWMDHGAPRAKARTINVMLVKKLSFAAGVAGATPGAPGVYNRQTSGLTLTPISTASGTGTLLVHELLHYLGLWHTSDEYWGGDLISDSPVCADPSGTGCADARNLMFPYFPVKDPLELSPGQQKVLHGSPWPYHPLHPYACEGHDVIGLNPAGFSASSTANGAARLTGTCGGQGAERVYLLRLEKAAKKLDVSVAGQDFAPVVHVRKDTCTSLAEQACVVGTAASATPLSIDNPSPGAYFIIVDSQADAGRFQLETSVTAE